MKNIDYFLNQLSTTFFLATLFIGRKVLDNYQKQTLGMLKTIDVRCDYTIERVDHTFSLDDYYETCRMLIV